MNDDIGIAIFGATRRGIRVAAEVKRLAPRARLSIFTFREEPWEPPFFDDFSAHAREWDAGFQEVRHVTLDQFRSSVGSGGCDLILAVSWRYVIPPNVFESAGLGAYLMHDSLLPAYRGFAPTVWAIINGEPSTGATLLEMAEGIDEGEIVDQAPVPIGSEETIADVMERVTEAYLGLLRRNFPALVEGNVTSQPQDHSRATYTCRRLPCDNRIDWCQSARAIFNLIRAVTAPYPGAFTLLDGQKLTVWKATIPDQGHRYVGVVPGRVVAIDDSGVVVLTGDGALRLEEVQIEGQERIAATRLLTRTSLTLGT